jgi:hypothetical protein
LIRKLAEHGWDVTSRDRDVEWWAQEIWTVESVWAPHGFTVFLTWLIDPQKGESDWGVGVPRTTGREARSGAGRVHVDQPLAS